MAGTFLNWLIPGLVAVGGGTALAISLGSASMSSDLETRLTGALVSADLGWAGVEIDGRDAILTGTATTQEMIDQAAGRISPLHGVRSVESAVTLAEFVSPFPFEASRADGHLTLQGGFPDNATHDAIVKAAPEATDKTRLLSGAPNTASFKAAALFAVQVVAEMDEGSAQLQDLKLSVSGRAASADAYGRLLEMSEKVPAGIALSDFSITPVLASPYRWEASFDGENATVSGSTPDDALGDRLRAVGGSVPVSTTLSIASGEPSGFEANTLTLFRSLLSLEHGSVSITDGEIRLEGAPRTAEIAEKVTEALTDLGGTVSLEAPRVAEYIFSATKSEGGISLLGFVPDEKTRDRAAAQAKASSDKLKLARGAPERFDSGLDFGFSALERMSEGEFTLSATRLTLTGRAKSLADFTALSTIVAEGAPQGLSLGMADVAPPIANPYTFTARKDSSGKTSLSGYVPSEVDRMAIQSEISGLAADQSVLADGAPAGFLQSVRHGMTVLNLLDTGTLLYDGKGWSITGAVDSAQKGFAADAAYSIAGLRTAGWSYTVKLPALPIIAPYAWGAQKTADGTLRFTGFAPDQGFKDSLVRRGGAASDATLLGAGAPDKFADNAGAGLDALMQLEEGSLGLAGRTWSLTGRAATAEDRTRIQDGLSSRVDPSLWRVAIEGPDAAPIVTPYLWSATKQSDGSVDLSGYFPTKEMQQRALQQISRLGRNTTSLASGEPSGFWDDVLAGVEALTHLESGTASFDGSKWTLVGRAKAASEGELALSALLKGSSGGVHWDRAIEGLAPPPAPASSEAPQASSSAPAPESSSAPQPSSEQSIISVAPPSSSEPTVASSSEPPVTSSEPVRSQPVATTAEDTEDVATQLVMPTGLVFEVSRMRGEGLVLKGAVKAEALRSYLGVISGGAATDAVTVDPSLPDSFIRNSTEAVSAINDLAEGRAGFDGKRWWLTGKAANATARDAVLAAISSLPTGSDWSTNVGLVPAIDLCRDTVGALAERNLIVFNSGSSILSKESSAPLDELAADLEICPDANVHVEGHTDSDGAEDVNLALSVERAEAVVAALIDRGVSVERLYAEGYGETMPIASNDTRQGKQANRRIAFTISEDN